MSALFIIFPLGLLLIIFGILLINGKCLNIIAGYNMLKEEEKNQYNKKLLGTTFGIFLFIIGFLTLILGVISNFQKKYINISAIIFIIIIITSTIILSVLVNSKKYKLNK